ALEHQILETTKQKGEEWINDVIVVYYQGATAVGKDGRRLLRTSKSRSMVGGEALKHMVGVSDLRPAAGLEIAVLNVSGTRPAAQPTSPVAEVVAYLLYFW